jgi:capsular exopolysaccharide synthesis family protein
MKKIKNTQYNAQQEVNLKLFFRKIYKYKWFFILSIISFACLALIYIFWATPKYEVSTSILIDSSGSNRVLGDSKYVDGSIGLIEMEKNLYNEMSIIKSFSLLKQTTEDLNLDVSYFTRNQWFKTKEHYGHFPFKVTLFKSEAQLYNIPFEVEFLKDEKYRLTIKGNKFKVFNPFTGSTHEVKKDLNYSSIFSFGEKVQHEYFNFTLNKPGHMISSDEFYNVDLQFIIHDVDNVANDYLEKLDVSNIDIQASILKVVSSGAVVDKEISFLRKLTENYIQNKLILRNKIATSKETFIRNQLNAISDSLLNVELNLEQFKKSKNAVNLSASALNAMDLTQNLQVDKAKIELDIKYNNSLIDYIENNRNNEDFVIPNTTIINDPIINESIKELKRLHADKAKKKFYLTSNNQEMTVLNAQIEETTQILLNDLRNSTQSLKFAQRGVRSQLSSYNGLISSLPTSEKQLLGIQRQSNLYENLFNYLSQELAKTGIARAETISDTRVLDEARMVGNGPIAPQKMLLMLLAIILGTIIPLVWMIWFEPNDIIQNSEQIQANTNIPVIANIANHDKKAKKTNLELSNWKVKESFRDLSANLKFKSNKQGCTILGIASIMPGEGKTFCSVNLGITFAETGKKTIIIDTDLRNPSLMNEFKFKGKGLSDFLQSDISSVDDIIHPHEKLSNLHFIPTSVVKNDIHALLSSNKMLSLISELKERYDYILIDSPPYGLVSDYVLFSDLIDINLFVVRRKIAKIAFLKDFKKLMAHGKKKKSYIIFNDVMNKEHMYGYGQMYGSTREPHIKDSLSV